MCKSQTYKFQMNKSFKAENQIMQIALGKPPTTTQIKNLKNKKAKSVYNPC